MQFGELKKSTTPTPASTAIPQVNLEQLANNKAERDAIAKDKEKNDAREWVKAKEASDEGNYAPLIQKYNELADKKNITEYEQEQIDNEYKRINDKYHDIMNTWVGRQRAINNGESDLLEYIDSVVNARMLHSLEGKITIPTAIGIANMGATLTRPLTTLAGLVDPNLRETNAEVQNQLDEWNEVAPVASTIGDMAGMLGLYSGVNIAPETIKNVGARLAINQGIDNVLDVIPRLKTNYDAGKYNNPDGTLNEKALLTDIALQEGMSAVGNGIGEGINAISNRLAKNRAIKDFSVDDILENSTPEELGLDVIPNLNQADDVAKNILNNQTAEITDDVVNVVDDAVKNSNNVTSSELNNIDPADKALLSNDVFQTHTADEIANMKAYTNSTDLDLLDYIQKARGDEYVKPFRLNDVSEKMANDIKTATGIDTKGNKLVIDQNTINGHIDKRHGVKGKNDHSMSDDNTLARIQYVLDNYDDFFKGIGTSSLRTADGKYSPTIVFVKKIDGQYYVVEAVTDAKSKTNRIVSAYIGDSNSIETQIKKGSIVRVSNVTDNQSLPRTSLTETESTSDTIINQPDENIKFENEIKNYNGDVGTPKDIPQYERGKVSETRTNTLENSGINTKEELESEYLDPNKFKYEDETESMQMERAISDIINDPKGEYEKVMSKTMDNGSEDDVNKLFIFYNEAVKVARESDNPEAWKEASKIYKQIQELGTDRAKGLQAFAKFSRNTKEGIMAQGLRDIRSELEKEMGNSVAKETVDKILDNELKNLDELLSKAMDVGFESREGKKILAQFGKICDKYTPKTYRGKLQTILMDNMLGNFRTLISRNAGGNVGYNALEFARQPITALYDKVLSKRTGARTRTGWSRDKIASSLNGFKNGFLDEIDDVRSGLHTAKDGESTLPKAIDLNRHTWSENHASNGSVVYNKLGLNKNESVNKFMDASGKVANKIDDLVKHGLSMGDRPFYEAAYNQRLSELTDLRSRGLLSDDLMSLSDEEFNVIAELSAKMDGLSATYQDDSAIAEALSLFKEGLGKVSEEFTGFNWLAQLSTPFVKTPGNIIDKAIDYSPLGFVKRYGEVISDKVRGRDFNQQRFVDEAGRNILGTGLVGGGYALARNGIVNGAYDEDADVKNAQKNSGMIEYGLNLPNNYNMDMSWIPVLGTDAIIGSAINDSLKNNPDATFGEAVGNGATAMLNTLLDQSSTQGLQRVFGGTNSYGSSGWGDNIKSTIESGLGQFVPSLSRQIANSTDQYQREISDGDRTYEMNNILSGIPIAREANLQPKVDNEGNLVLQNQGRGLGSRLAENMLFPGTLKQVEQSPLDEEAMRIYDADETKGEKKQFVTTPKRNDIATDDYVPTDEDYRRYKEDVGTKKRELGNLLLNNPDYQKLTDVQKSEILSSLYSQSKMASELTFKPGYTTNEKNVKAIAEGRYDDAISKLIDSQTVSKAIQNKEEDMSEADGALSYLKKEDKTEEEKGKILYNNLKSNKTTVGLVENGESYEAKDGKSYSGYEGVYHFYNDKSELDENGEISEETQQKKALVEELNDLGVKGTSADKLYNHAKDKIPSLTTEQFATTFNKINTDGNTKIKQDEMFAYFKKNHLTEKQATDLWKAYGDWETVPYLKEDGTWGKH